MKMVTFDKNFITTLSFSPRLALSLSPSPSTSVPHSLSLLLPLPLPLPIPVPLSLSLSLISQAVDKFIKKDGKRLQFILQLRYIARYKKECVWGNSLCVVPSLLLINNA